MNADDPETRGRWGTGKRYSHRRRRWVTVGRPAGKRLRHRVLAAALTYDYALARWVERMEDAGAGGQATEEHP